nr:DNA ligase [uncultured archaeon]
MNKIEQLKKEIAEANLAYRTGESIILDSEYDDLIEELEQLAPHDELLKKIGHTPIDESRKRKLPITMASMNKIKTLEEYKDWLRLKKIPEDTIMICTPKFDGLSLCTLESNGDAWTRGDGVEGQLSTEHLRIINPKQSKQDFYSVGEVIMSKKNWERVKNIINPRTGKPYKNPRNMAAGKMNDKHPSPTLKDFSYVRYGLIGGVYQTSNKEEQIIVLNELNDHQVKYKKIEAGKITTEMLVDLYKEWLVEFEIDGIIIEINDSKLREKLGRETSTENPCYARAFKSGSFEMTKESKILGLIRQVSKLGYLKPVAQIEPTELDGATVRRVTCINEKFVVGYKIHVGSKIKVKRSGMVIPLITEVDGVKVEKDKKGDFIFPYDDNKLTIHKCPICNGEVTWNENKVEAICTNPKCVGINLGKIISFFEILEVDGVGEGVCEILFNSGYDTIEKILKMSEKDMFSLEGFAERKSEKTFENIHSKLRDISLSKLQHASGCFPGLGSKKLLLLEHFENLPSAEEIIKIGGFSDISAKAYLDGINNFNNFIKNLPITIKKTEKIMAKTNSLEGQVYVFTGVRRKDLEAIIQEKGGKIGSGISKTSTCLVMAEKGSGSAKEIKAEQLGQRIITVQELENELK